MKSNSAHLIDTCPQSMVDSATPTPFRCQTFWARHISAVLLIAASLNTTTLLAATEGSADNQDKRAAPAQHNHQIYKTIDSDGNVIFTDAPPLNQPAEPVTLNQTNRHEATPETYPSRRSQSTEPLQRSYSIQLKQPRADMKIGPAMRAIPVSVFVGRRLRGNENIQYFLDGKAVGSQTKSLSSSIPVSIKSRGRRSVSAKIINTQGKTLASSGSVNVFVIRPNR